MHSFSYREDSFGDRSDALQSAEIIAPIIIDLVKPRSVIDVGCCTGEFLSVFQKNGVKKIFGIDGPWINKDKLLISKKDFQHIDLEKSFKIGKNFDLALSLEVAEHLSKKAAKLFIDSITKLAPVILFSAAIPYQGGLHHLNEQWPDYWAKLFNKKGYVPIDCIRDKIWTNNKVSFWYAQNSLLYVRKSYLKYHKKLRKLSTSTEVSALSKVHPEIYIQKARGLDIVIKMIPPVIKRALKKFAIFFDKL